MPRPVPVAALATIGYVEPATVAVADAPADVSVTLATASLLVNPDVVNSVPAKVTAVPYVFVLLLAVTVSAFAVTVNETVFVAAL